MEKETSSLEYKREAICEIIRRIRKNGIIKNPAELDSFFGIDDDLDTKK
ncbi:hypothetical protein KY358_04215 [Candidatus Woesearchaeota archaeon]|nr:hypothetical protein [Candidatus Woesearchaeota archaeon]